MHIGDMKTLFLQSLPLFYSIACLHYHMQIPVEKVIIMEDCNVGKPFLPVKINF